MLRRNWAMPFRVLKSALWKFFEDDGPFMARGLAFGLLIYCIPLALMTVTALSYLLASSSGALTWVRQLTGALIPQFEKQFNNYLNTVVQNRGLLGLASFLAFLFASSTTFGSMRLVLNTVFGAKESRGIVHGKIMEMVMMVLTSAVVFVIMSVVYLLTLVESLAAALPLWKTGIRAIEQVFPRFHAFVHPLSLVLASVVTFTATVVMFWFLYRFTPARRPGNEALFIGATVAAALFEISKFAFAWYVASAHRTTALYGTLSGLAFFLVWMYYASAVFVFGAEISSALDQQRKRKKR